LYQSAITERDMDALVGGNFFAASA